MDRSNSKQAEDTNPSDGDLMAGLLAGDPAVLRILLSRYLPSLRRYAERLVGPGPESEEAVQEAFIRLWEKRDRWREDGSVRALLFTLTRNAAVDHLRRRRRETPLADHHVRFLPSPSPSPLDNTEERELRSLAEAAVRNLPPRRQEVFRLIRESGLSYREVSETLGISAQTVANLMSLALTDLRTSLKPILEGQPEATVNSPDQGRRDEASGSD